MNKELIKQQLKLRYKPQARPMPKAEAAALLAKYGQKYRPGESKKAE